MHPTLLYRKYQRRHKLIRSPKYYLNCGRPNTNFQRNQNGIASQPVTPVVQPQPSTSQGSATVSTDVKTSSLQPASVPVQNLPTPVAATPAATVIQSDMANTSPIVESQSPLTVSQALVQPTQSVMQSPTEQIVAPQVVSASGK